MSEFFEPPPPPPEPPGWQHRPEWFGPPENSAGVVVPLELTLARTPDVALLVSGVHVYPTGVLFHLPLLMRERINDPMPFMPFHPRGQELGDEVLRLGAQFADGSKATNLDRPFYPPEGDERPPGPVLTPNGGGGGDRRWDVSFWLWPLPREDPFALVVEWPARGVELTRHDVAVAPLVEAAARCEELWPDESRGGGAMGNQMLFVRGMD